MLVETNPLSEPGSGFMFTVARRSACKKILAVMKGSLYKAAGRREEMLQSPDPASTPRLSSTLSNFGLASSGGR